MPKVFYFVNEGEDVLYSQFIEASEGSYVPVIRLPHEYTDGKDLKGWRPLGEDYYWDFATMLMPAIDLVLVADLAYVLGIKMYYNSSTNQLVTIDMGDRAIVAGANDTAYLSFYFTGINTANLYEYECRILIEKPNEEASNDLYASPITVDGLNAHYRLKMSGWLTDTAGSLKITAKLKKVINDVEYEIDAFGIAIVAIEESVIPSSQTVTQAQYDAIISHINTLYMIRGSSVAISAEEPVDEFVNFWIKIE